MARAEDDEVVHRDGRRRSPTTGLRPAVRWPSPFLIGALIGAASLPVAYAAAPMPRGAAVLGVDLQVLQLPSGEVSGSEDGPLLQRADLRAGARVRGSRTIRNQTGRTLIVEMRARPSTRALDRALRVRLAVDGRPVFTGDLLALGSWTERWFQLRRGEERELQVEIEVPAAGSAAIAGLSAAVSLELRARPRRA